MFAEFVATGAPLSALFISFLVYSFAGWLYESTICALANYGRFANSGFLLGPCCPIYGAGALACWFLLRGIPGVVAQFVAAALVCSVLEYSVGAMLERLTGARFWDYSKFPFNIKGRVCLYGAMLFGAGAVVICRAAEPSLLAALQAVPRGGARRGRGRVRGGPRPRRGVCPGKLAAAVAQARTAAGRDGR